MSQSFYPINIAVRESLISALLAEAAGCMSEISPWVGMPLKVTPQGREILTVLDGE